MSTIQMHSCACSLSLHLPCTRCGRRHLARYGLLQHFLKFLLAERFSLIGKLPLTHFPRQIDATKVPTSTEHAFVPRQRFLPAVSRDANHFTCFASYDVVIKLHVTWYEGEQGVIPPSADVLSRVEAGASLPHENVAWDDLLPAILLDT